MQLGVLTTINGVVQRKSIPFSILYMTSLIQEHTMMEILKNTDQSKCLSSSNLPEYLYHNIRNTTNNNVNFQLTPANTLPEYLYHNIPNTTNKKKRGVRIRSNILAVQNMARVAYSHNHQTNRIFSTTKQFTRLSCIQCNQLS